MSAESYPYSSEVPKLTVITHARPFWSPLHATDETYEPPIFEIYSPSSLSDIAKKLPNKFDGFTLGLSVNLEFLSEGSVTNIQEVVQRDGKIYLPSDRAEVVDLRTIEEEAAFFTPVLLETGATSAVRIVNGFLAYNPDIIRIVEVT